MITPASVGQGPVTNASTKRTLPKFAVVLFASLLLLGGVSAGLYNYVYMSPERIWKGAMAHTAEGLERVIAVASEQDSKGFKADGTFSLTKPIVADGSMTARWYESNGAVQADIGAVGARITMDMQAVGASSGSTPDLYLKLSGLEGVDALLESYAGGAGLYGDVLSQLNEQWYFLDHTLVDQYLAGTDQSSKTTTSKEDVVNYMNSLSSVMKDRLFSTDSENAVLIMDEVYGKEDFEGDSTYKMKVNLDKENLKQFINELVKVTDDSPLGEAFMGTSESLADQLDIDGLMKSIDEADFTNASADVWVDAKARFVRNVRIYPVAEKKDTNYLDFGVDYQNGDVVPLIIKATIDEEGMTGSLAMGIDFNQSNASSKLWTDIKLDGETTVEAKTELMIQPSDEQVSPQVPENAKNVFELLGGLTGGLLGDPSTNPFETLEGSTLNDMYDDSSMFPLLYDDEQL